MIERKKDDIRKIDKKLYQLEKDISYLEKSLGDIGVESNISINNINLNMALDERDIDELKNMIRNKLVRRIEELKDKHNKIEDGVSFDDYVSKELNI